MEALKGCSGFDKFIEMYMFLGKRRFLKKRNFNAFGNSRKGGNP